MPCALQGGLGSAAERSSGGVLAEKMMNGLCRNETSMERPFAAFLKRICSCAPPLRKSVPDSELLSPEGRDIFLNTSSLLPNNFRRNFALNVQPDV